MPHGVPIVRPQDRVHARPKPVPAKALPALGLAALGVVYGDIGTSPIYVLQLCFHGPVPLAHSAANVLGILSLVFWSLVVVIAVKYLAVILRADNEGEGGILALMAVLDPWRRRGAAKELIVLLGIFGAALLYGDGMITPAISVLSAVEGLRETAPAVQPYIAAIAITILALLFLFQRRGTATVGRAFGPVMLIWFGTLAALGLWGIAQYPGVLAAVDPAYALRFFELNKGTGYVVLGSVFLAVTGGEALYADIGHFGKAPIRLAWFTVVMPALLLNYFGQCAALLAHPQRSGRPFYELAPPWAVLPLVLIATAATVIASQAVISGAFSLTRQAVQLGYSPRVGIVHTSPEEIGQVYIPAVNWPFMAGTTALVIGFKTSEHLGSAYGVAVSATMVITTILAFSLMRDRWRWTRPAAVAVALGFGAIDLAFFGANMTKFLDGGWFPLLVAAAVLTIMTTWRAGRESLARNLGRDVLPLHRFMQELKNDPPVRVPGTAVFMTGQRRGTPAMLQRHLSRIPALQERVVLLTVLVKGIPRVAADKRLRVRRLAAGFSRVYAYYGYLQRPNIPVLLRECARSGLEIDVDQATYYVSKAIVVPERARHALGLWRQHLFAFMTRNQSRVDVYFNLPYGQVIELGLEVPL